MMEFGRGVDDVGGGYGGDRGNKMSSGWACTKSS